MTAISINISFQEMDYGWIATFEQQKSQPLPFPLMEENDGKGDQAR
jgi:hypothetical protein